MDAICPDPSRWRTIAVLKEARLRDILLLEDVHDGARLAGHHVRFATPDDAQDLSRKLPECTALLQSFQHPGVPVLRECLTSESGFWYLFDYVEGPSVADYPPTVETVAPDCISHWLYQTLDILHYIHTRGTIVGGFTPSDLVLTQSGVRLVDSGYLEKLLPEASAMARTPFRRSMLSPEERYSTRHSVAGDLYSAGAMAFWLATGRGPGSPEGVAQARRTPVPQRAVEGRAQSLMEERPDLDPVTAEAIARLIQFRPSDRGAGADVVLAPMTCSLAGIPAPSFTLPPAGVKRWLSDKPAPPPARVEVKQLLDATMFDDVPEFGFAPPMEPIGDLRQGLFRVGLVLTACLLCIIAASVFWVRTLPPEHRLSHHSTALPAQVQSTAPWSPGNLPGAHTWRPPPPRTQP